MVEDRVTDGKRVAQLLASELTGLSTAPLDRVDVADAAPDAEPTPEGTFAYAIVLDDERVGRVFVHEETARVDLSVAWSGSEAAVSDPATPVDDVDTDGLSITSTGDEPLRVHVEYGAAVKRAADLIASALEHG